MSVCLYSMLLERFCVIICHCCLSQINELVNESDLKSGLTSIGTIKGSEFSVLNFACRCIAKRTLAAGLQAAKTLAVRLAPSSDSKSPGRQSPAAQPTKRAVMTTLSKSTGNLTSVGECGAAGSPGSGKLRCFGVALSGDNNNNNNNNNHDDIYGVSSWRIAIARVHPVHMMNTDSAPVGRQPSDQANLLGL